jgi:hypothetical protein
MRITKILYQLAVFVGMFILLSGLFLKVTQSTSSGLVFRKRGSVQFQTIDGNGALTLAIMILAFALWMYTSYKKEAATIEKMKRMERNEIALRKRNQGHTKQHFTSKKNKND